MDLCDFNVESGPMNEKSAKFLFRQIVNAVHHCHANGVVHADVKSENVLIEMKTGRAVLIDFGYAFELKATESYHGTRGERESKTELMVDFFIENSGHENKA